MAETSSRLRILLLLAGLAGALILAGRACSDGQGFTGGGNRAALEFQGGQLPDLRPVDVADDARTEAYQRNPFAFYVPPTPTPSPTPVRPTPTPRPTPPPVTPGPPRPTSPPGPPPPPRFDYQYLGHLGPDSLKVAVFRKGENIDVAAEGEVFAELFIVRRIGLESVEIGYVGFPEEEKTSVSLIN